MELTRLIEHLEERWHLAFTSLPGAEHYQGPEVCWVNTNIDFPMINGAFGADMDAARVDETVERVLSVFARARVSMNWMVGPSTRPGDLGRRLAARGLRQEDSLTGMALDLKDFQGQALPPELRVQRVPDEQALAQGLEIFTTCFSFRPEARRAPHEAYRRAGVDGGGGWTHYLCFKQGRLLAFCSRLTHGQALAIHNVSVLPGARRQGLATLLVGEVLSRSREEGYQVAVLQSTPMGRPVYLGLGFKIHCMLDFYLFAPGGAG